MTYRLSVRCALISISVQGGKASNTSLSLDKPGREQLVRDGLITVTAQRRPLPMMLRLTDRGWKAFEGEMVAEPPPRSGAAGGALYATLHALGRVIAREKRSARELLNPALEPTPQPSPLPAAAPNPAPVSDTKASAASAAEGQNIEALVHDAYTKLARKDREWVELHLLRDALSDVARDDLDSVLRFMLRAREIEMTSHEDQSRLSKAQRASSLRVGRLDMHLVSMSR